MSVEADAGADPGERSRARVRGHRRRSSGFRGGADDGLLATAIDPTGYEIQSIALSVQVMIDPARRGYDAQTRERLAELFGPPASWTPSTQGLAWARVSALVTSFTDSAKFALELPCTYDLEVAAAKYFYALADGFAPLSFHFNGTIFYRAADGRLQVVPVPWSATAQFRCRSRAGRR